MTTRRSSSVFSKNSRARRVCSLCDRMGHNARTCISTQAITARKQEKIIKKPASTYIPVQVQDQGRPSPHVVSLNTNRKDSSWHHIPTYHEESVASPQKRQTVDFADLVRQANKVPDGHEKIRESLDTPLQKNTAPFDILEEIAHLSSKKMMMQKESSPMVGQEIVHQLEVRDGVDFKTRIKETSLKPFVPVLRQVQTVRERMGEFVDRLSFKRFAISMVVLLLLIAVPFPAMGYVQKIQSDTRDIVEKSTHAFLSLQSSTVAAFSHNIPQAQYDLNEALNAFGSAEQIIDKEYKALVYVAGLLPVVGTKVKSRQELLLAGHSLALGNTYLVKGLDEAQLADTTSLAERMTIIRRHVRSALPQYEEAMAHLQEVHESALPVEYQQSFTDFRSLFAGFITDMQNMDHVIQGVERIVGAQGFRRYLVLFQNNHELRPTGGFVGSYATIDVQNGKIINIDVPGGGSYDVQGQLDVYVKPPLPLQLVNSRWEFQDGNWFPDFRDSAQKMAWFYRHSRDTTVDGVIAINASVLPRLLKVLGPLNSDAYDMMLSSEDVLSQLQTHVENYDNVEENKPKEVLSVLLQQLLDSVGSVGPDQTMSLVSQLQEALTQKEIQFYFEDDDLQTLFGEYGWTGEIAKQDVSQDYLMVVNTNLGGKKSDAEISQHMYHEAVVQDDGSIIDTVVIRRTHEGNSPQEFFDHPNVNYIRAYVPEGAELIDAGGFTFPDEASFSVPPRWYNDDIDLARIETDETINVKTGTRITHEYGKTVFGNWVVTMPQQVSEVYFTYRLPFTRFDQSEEAIDGIIQKESLLASLTSSQTNSSDTSRYSILFQKQSGSDGVLSHAIIYPDGWRPIWKTGTSDVQLSINGSSIEKNFETDEIFGIVMIKN